MSCPPPGDLPDSGIDPALLHLLHWKVGSVPLVTWEARTQACLQTKAEMGQLSFLILKQKLKNNNRKRHKRMFLNWRALSVSLSHTRAHRPSQFDTHRSHGSPTGNASRKCTSPQFSSMCCTGQCKLELHSSAGTKCFRPFKKKVNIKTF